MKTLSLKNYRVINQLGQGGMGMVYLAEDIALGRLVALKFLAPYLVRDQEILKRFRAEARSQAKLTHPHITTVYAFEEVGEQAFLVLEYVDGDSLEQRIATQGRFAAAEAVKVFSDILNALEYAHKKGVVHRDIKPGNIGFTQAGVVKLMDFGIALNLEESWRLTRTGHILGTPHYMSPEQILGKQADARSDIYALGITLFEALTGKVPFEGDSDYAVSVAQVNEPPPSPRSFGFPDITPALEEVIFKALAKDPADRFESGAGFRQSLKAALAAGSSPAGMVPGERATQALGGAVPAASSPDTLGPAKIGLWLLRFPQVLSLPLVAVALGAILFIRKPDLRAWLDQPGRKPTQATTAETGKRREAPKPLPPAAAPEKTPQPSANEAGASGSGEALPSAPVPTEPRALTMTSLPAPSPKPEPPAPQEKKPVEWLREIKGKLKERGFGKVQLMLDEEEKVMLSGTLKSEGEKQQVTQAVKEVGAPLTVDYSRLTIAREVKPKPVRRPPPAPAAREAAPAPEISRKPLPPRLDQGGPGSSAPGR